MKIRLVNFRKYIDQSFELNDGITKISGESGTGKSTIFDAIYWCLYGKLQNVGRRDGSNVITGSTQVIFNIDIPNTKHNEEKHNIQYSNIQIERSGQKSVSIWINNELVEESLSQSKINDIFGTADKFQLTSYLKAESLHPLISAPPSERRELTSLLFPDAGKYDILKLKLIETRKKDETTLSKYKNIVISSESSISTLEESNPWVKDPLPPNNDSDTSIQESISKLKKDRDFAIGVIHQYNTTKSQLESLALEEPIDIEPLTIEKEKLKSKLTQITVESSSKETKLKLLNDELSSLHDKMGTISQEIGYSTLDLQECERLKSLCDEIISIISTMKLPIPFTKEDIDNKISSIDNKRLELINELPILEESYHNMEYNDRISNILTCPCCQAKLRYTDTLEEVKEDITPKPVEKMVTISDIQKTKFNIDNLESQLDDLRKNSIKYNNLITKESSINAHNKDIKMKLISTNPKLYRDKIKLYIKYINDETNITNKINTINSDTREYITQDEFKKIDNEIKAISSKIQKAHRLESQKSNLSSTISTLKSKYNYLSEDVESSDKHIQSFDSQIEELGIRLNVVRKYKDKVRIAAIYSDHKKKVSQYKDLVTKTEKRIDASYKLESILGSTYQQYVGAKLSELEYDISILGKIFFDETTNITLTPGKETSTGTIKPSFDIKVENNGIQYDDIRGMSTGEKKRLSIILMMVLSKYLDGKLLLLDEAFTSFSMDVRGIVLAELTKLGIPVYLTSHDDIPGGYDSEIDLNSLKPKKK